MRGGNVADRVTVGAPGEKDLLMLTDRHPGPREVVFPQAQHGAGDLDIGSPGLFAQLALGRLPR
ncbi:hypothetical protein ACH4GK_28490 [Streptomyces rimosus]|uniref:hypothetical protein n=1 Tax=Streptomyces rimosus TaxID=1927 RepID=UPI0004C66AF3|nr:hypothetical protein [Streptomyces rimosus]